MRHDHGVTLLVLGTLVLAATSALRGQQSLPVPSPGWGTMASGGECGRVTMWVATSIDDGHNDPEVKLRMENHDTHRVHVRLVANLTSDHGETKQ